MEADRRNVNPTFCRFQRKCVGSGQLVSVDQDAKPEMGPLAGRQGTVGREGDAAAMGHSAAQASMGLKVLHKH